MIKNIKPISWPKGAHPLDQAHVWSAVPLEEPQEDFIKAWSIPDSRVCRTFPNSGGKTSVVMPVCILSAMMAFPGAMCYATSGSERQVKEQFFEQQVIPRVEPLKAKGWTIKKGDMKVEAPNGSTLLCYVCADANKVEGFHGYWATDHKTGFRYYRPCVYFMDECKSIPDEVMNAVWRIKPDFLGAVSTPGYVMDHWFTKAINPDDLDAVVRQRRKRYGLPDPVSAEQALHLS